jgi:hypothetical protein
MLPTEPDDEGNEGHDPEIMNLQVEMIRDSVAGCLDVEFEIELFH